MPKMLVMYDEPTNRARFEKHHEKVYEWTRRVPGVVSASYQKVVQTQNIDPAPYMVVEIEFSSMADIEHALELAKTPQAQEDAKLLRAYLPRGRTVIVTE